MDGDRTMPEHNALDEDTRPIEAMAADEDAVEDSATRSRRWVYVAMAAAAATLGGIVGATVSLAGGSPTIESPIASTSVASMPSETSTSAPGAVAAVTIPPDTQPTSTTAPTTVPTTAAQSTTTPTTPTTAGAPVSTIPPTVPTTGSAASQG